MARHLMLLDGASLRAWAASSWAARSSTRDMFREGWVAKLRLLPGMVRAGERWAVLCLLTSGGDRGKRVPHHAVEAFLLPAFILAAGRGYANVCALLVRLGVDPGRPWSAEHEKLHGPADCGAELQCQGALTALIAACAGGHIEVCQLLLPYKQLRRLVPDPLAYNVRTARHSLSALRTPVLTPQSRASALEAAAGRGHVDACQLLLGDPVSPAVVNDAALCAALRGGHYAVCELLLPSAPVDGGHLELAATHGDKVLVMLVARHMPTGPASTDAAMRAARAAACAGREDSSRALLGAVIHRRPVAPAEWQAMLIATAHGGCVDLTKYVLKMLPRLTRVLMNQALVLAASHGRKDTLALLLSVHGYREDECAAALLSAAGCGRAEACAALLNTTFGRQGRFLAGHKQFESIMISAVQGAGDLDTCALLLDYQGEHYAAHQAGAPPHGNAQAFNLAVDLKRTRLAALINERSCAPLLQETMRAAVLRSLRARSFEVCDFLIRMSSSPNKAWLTIMQSFARSRDVEACEWIAQRRLVRGGKLRELLAFARRGHPGAAPSAPPAPPTQAERARAEADRGNWGACVTLARQRPADIGAATIYDIMAKAEAEGEPEAHDHLLSCWRPRGAGHALSELLAGAARNREWDVCSRLLENGGCQQASSSSRAVALKCAAEAGQVNLVRQLVGSADAEDRRAALVLAAANARWDVVAVVTEELSQRSEHCVASSRRAFAWAALGGAPSHLLRWLLQGADSASWDADRATWDADTASHLCPPGLEEDPDLARHAAATVARAIAGLSFEVLGVRELCGDPCAPAEWAGRDVDLAVKLQELQETWP